jgi:hypothetical protein
LSQVDPSQDDYYNFLALGVLTRFDIAKLNDPNQLLAPFDSSWREKMDSFFPQTNTQDANFSEELRAEVSQLMRR